MSDDEMEAGGGGDAPCSKDLKKYFYVIAAVALVVLVGALVYRESSGQGLRLSVLMERLAGGGSAVNAPLPGSAPLAASPMAASPMTVGARVGAPTGAGGFATLPPVIAGGPAPVAGGGPFSDVVNVLRNSVVSVSASSAGTAGGADPLGLTTPDGLPHFANPLTRSVENIGSGAIIRNDGYIITNYHVVRGANSVFVTVQDDVGSTRYAAEIVKMDEALDLALLKIAPKAPLSPAVLGDSDVLRVADEVIAIGSPFGLDMTVSRGIVSARRKSMVIEGVTHSNLLQTDAAINQGNSGGPLVATNGAVIGINTAIYTPNGAFAGIGFAVPSNQVRTFVLDEIGWLPTNTADGPTFGLVALPGQTMGGVGSAGPAIIAGTPAPHTDGRQNMECTTCHDLIQAGGVNPGTAPVRAPMMPVVAAVPPPPIAMGTTSPHTDGRQNMNCATCHQMLPAAAAVALAPNGYRFAQAPSSLAINVQGARGPASAGGGQSLLGASLVAMSPELGIKTGQPAGRGVFLNGVAPNSPAAVAGLRPGDILLKVDGRPVSTPAEVTGLLSGISSGRSVRLGVLRDGDVRAMDLVVGNAGAPTMVVAAAPQPMAGAMGAAPAVVLPPGAVKASPAAKPPTEFNWLGLEIETFQTAPQGAPIAASPAVPAARGAQIAEVTPGSRAALAGLKANDIVIEVNNRAVADAARLDAAIKAAEAAGQKILLRVNRSGQEFYIAI